ncbi:MAG TPA: L-histidine N(alpha)-methyltransferase [Pseudolabrys sp.]|nr:L-histidine N(alpha)-methyltransferase [Pseudolabrys sp.]
MVAVARKKDLSAAPLSEFSADAIAGLSATPKRLQPKYFYDAEGSRLFEQITETPEYYPTRCEMQALRSHAGDIAVLVPDGAALIEFGSGSSKKVRLLLAAEPALSVYVPVDISPEMLEQETAAIRHDYPALTVLPVAADFTVPFALPPEAVAAQQRVGFFPGSTIGNFEPYQAAHFLRNAASILGRGSLMLIGVDLVKDPAILNAAYNDAGGVTARFNLNLLKRMNRELNANFDLDSFEHHAFFNRARSRVEMHLASRKRQKVRVAGETFSFDMGESIHTENSYKYSIQSFGALARGAGWSPLRSWTDDDGYFSIQAFTCAPERAASA